MIFKVRTGNSNRQENFTTIESRNFTENNLILSFIYHNFRKDYYFSNTQTLSGRKSASSNSQSQSNYGASLVRRLMRSIFFYILLPSDPPPDSLFQKLAYSNRIRISEVGVLRGPTSPVPYTSGQASSRSSVSRRQRMHEGSLWTIGRTFELAGWMRCDSMLVRRYHCCRAAAAALLCSLRSIPSIALAVSCACIHPQ